jgi:8-oxo-dGTP pyrophosphatase MutT (NUDIX family)
MRKDGRQCAALPFKEEGGETLVMLITSRDTGRWILPKGWFEKRLSESELAAKEAYEEAGIVGQISPTPISSYRYTKRLPIDSKECSVRIYPLRVTELLTDWPEAHQRRREWFTVAQAALNIDDCELVTILLTVAASNALSKVCRPSGQIVEQEAA